MLTYRHVAEAGSLLGHSSTNNTGSRSIFDYRLSNNFTQGDTSNFAGNIRSHTACLFLVGNRNLSQARLPAVRASYISIFHRR
jgi:hypothetical protein